MYLSRRQSLFATGTAAVISPVGELNYDDKACVVNNGDAGELSVRLYEELQVIQYGRKADPFGWTTKVG